MTAKRLKSLCTEIYKTLNQLNLGYMSNIFKLSSSRATCKQHFLNLKIICLNQVNFDKIIWEHLIRKYGTTTHYILKLLKIFQPLSISWNHGKVSLSDVIYAKLLRSEDLASWVFFFFMQTSTQAQYYNLEIGK